MHLCYENKYLNEEVKYPDPSTSVSVIYVPLLQ